MTAAVHVISGPAHSGKTRRLLERFRALAGASIGAALWIAPTRRKVEVLRQHLLEDRSGCLAPHLFTFQDFAEEIIRVNDPAARPLSDLQRRLLADDLVAELHTRKQLSHFDRIIDTRGFAEAVFSLLAELKNNEIWPAHFARAAYRRGYRGRHAARTLNGRSISLKDRQCARIYARYQQRLIQHQLYDLEGRFWYARDLLAHGRRRPFAAVRGVFVDGFTDFTRTQHEILEGLTEWVDELWIALPDEAGEERAELFARPRAIAGRLQRLHAQVEHLAPSMGSSLPAGLAHIERQLFRPVRKVALSGNADGLLRIEAPGMLGEARMVAREIKSLLLQGVPADDVLVTMRDVQPYADLLAEVFTEYGIPVDVEGTDSLLRNAAVATLLRSVRLPDDDWPFAAVTALLRSGYFRPEWPELDDDRQLEAEALLRLLGEPRGRDAYLRAIRSWADRPQPGLEDEQAEESRRQRIHQLAQKCQAFLQRFFQAWDAAPSRATLAEHTAWLRRFADDLGITRTAAEDAHDRAALQRLWDELERWVRMEAALREGGQVRERPQFLRLLSGLALGAGLARTPRGPGRVRILSAELARHLAVPHLFVMGLGERSFPRLSASEPLFDESERQAFKQAGLDFPCVGDRMPDEMLLFYQVVTRARRRLVLSYPAVDDKGQALLPSSFLNTLLDCFEPDAVPVQQRRMLIQGYDRDAPLSPAEHRVRVARQAADGPRHLTADLAANLAAAADMVRRRLDSREFSAYDGLLRHPAVIAELGGLFGAGKVFSPTALETFITCPFRFYLQHVLKLEPLEEPNEEIEQTRRGSAFHRALARLHQKLEQAGVQQPTAAVNDQLLECLDGAVQEYVVRAPSLAAKELWRLEGQRLKRSASRYGAHWQEFVKPWLALKVEPHPYRFEVDFGAPSTDDTQGADPLLIQVDGIEVRIGGRIDRIDVADLPEGLGFWIIDYKTGSASHYKGTDLREFRRLQLTLYALAVQKVLLAGQEARPLGLAYWLVTDTGPKPAMPSGREQTSWLAESAAWPTVRGQLERWVATLVGHIREGTFPLKPCHKECTATCDFGQMCRIGQSRHVVEERAWQLSLPVVT